jgi:hypothetical protein
MDKPRQEWSIGGGLSIKFQHLYSVKMTWGRVFSRPFLFPSLLLIIHISNRNHQPLALTNLHALQVKGSSWSFGRQDLGKMRNSYWNLVFRFLVHHTRFQMAILKKIIFTISFLILTKWIFLVSLIQQS